MCDDVRRDLDALAEAVAHLATRHVELANAVVEIAVSQADAQASLFERLRFWVRRNIYDGRPFY